MSRPTQHFNLTARILHWSMAVLILAMLFVGIGTQPTSYSRQPASTDRHRHSAAGDRAPDQSPASPGTAFAYRPTRDTSARGQGLALVAVQPDVRNAAGRVGDAVCRRLSGDDVWRPRAAAHRAAQRQRLCDITQRPHMAGLVAICHRAAALGGRTISRLGTPRWRVLQHGAR